MKTNQKPFVSKRASVYPSRQRWEVSMLYLTGRATSRTVYADSREEAKQVAYAYMGGLVEITSVRHLG